MIPDNCEDLGCQDRRYRRTFHHLYSFKICKSMPQLLEPEQLYPKSHFQRSLDHAQETTRWPTIYNGLRMGEERNASPRWTTQETQLQMINKIPSISEESCGFWGILRLEALGNRSRPCNSRIQLSKVPGGRSRVNVWGSPWGERNSSKRRTVMFCDVLSLCCLKSWDFRGFTSYNDHKPLCTT